MSMVHTPSFGLAVREQGNPDAERLAIVLPGRLDTKDYEQMAAHVECLSSLGFLAVSFDPPGTWDSDGDLSDYTMTNYLKSVDELINHFGNRPTLAVGHSRGGSIAMRASTTNSNIRSLVAIMASYRFDTNWDGAAEWEAQGYTDDVRELPDGSGLTRTFRLPHSFLLDAVQYDMSEEMRRSIKPKLLITGSEDITCPEAELLDGYEQFGEPKTIVSVDTGHDYRKNPSTINHINQLIEQHVRAYW